MGRTDRQTVWLLLPGPKLLSEGGRKDPRLDARPQYKCLACHFLCNLGVTLTLSESQHPHLLEENDNALLLRGPDEIMYMKRFYYYHCLMT